VRTWRAAFADLVAVDLTGDKIVPLANRQTDEMTGKSSIDPGHK